MYVSKTRILSDLIAQLHETGSCSIELRIVSCKCILLYLRGRHRGSSLHPYSVVELQWGLRGPGPPERPGGPCETSVLRGFKGACKRPPEIAR